MWRRGRNDKCITSFINVKFEKKENKYFIELKIGAIGKTKISEIELKKIKPKDKISELNDKIQILENKYSALIKEFNDLKIKEGKNDDISIKDKVKEVLEDKEIKNKLLEELEKIIDIKYVEKEENQNKVEKKKESQILEKVENEINEIKKEILEKVDEKLIEKINNIKEEYNIMMEELNNLKIKLQYFQDNILEKNDLMPFINGTIENNILIKDISNYLNTCGFKNNKNYIELQLNITKKDIGKDIIFLNQNALYYNNNFERDDLEVIIDNINVPIKYKKYDNYNYQLKYKDSELSEKIDCNLKYIIKYYWNFEKEGIYTIKIIFRKILFNSCYMFAECENIIEIDCSKLDCSQIIDCIYMFYRCSSLKNINFEKLDFLQSKDFTSMFFGWTNLRN